MMIDVTPWVALKCAILVKSFRISLTTFISRSTFHGGTFCTESTPTKCTVTNLLAYEEAGHLLYLFMPQTLTLTASRRFCLPSITHPIFILWMDPQSIADRLDFS